MLNRDSYERKPKKSLLPKKDEDSLVKLVKRKMKAQKKKRDSQR